MRINTLLLVCCASILMFNSGTMWGQHGVLLPNKQASSTDDVSTRRGDVSNPLPDPDKRDTIHGKEDVSVVFGAGESSVISGSIVRWPADHGTGTGPFAPKPPDASSSFPGYDLPNPPSPDGKTTAIVGGYTYPGSLMIGSAYSKNAVVGIYDNDGEAAGAIRGIRLYGNSGGSANPGGGAAPGSLGNPPSVDASGNPLPWPWGASNTTDGYNAYDRSSNTYLGTYRYWPINRTVSAADAIPKAVASQLSDFLINPTTGLVTGTSANNIWGSYYPNPGNFIRPYSGTGLVLAINDPSAGTTVDNSIVGAVLRPFYNPLDNKYYVLIWNHVSTDTPDEWDQYLPTQTQFYFDIVTADTIYTATRSDNGKKDNDISLLETIIGNYGSGVTYADYQTKLDNDAEYIRPTTVLVSGGNDFNNITIGDVEWYAAFLASRTYRTDTVGPFYANITYGCGHLSGWAAYLRDIVRFDTISDNANGGTYPSGRYVDAAVRIMDNADVCVKGNVKDSTTSTATSLGVLDGPYTYLDAGNEEKTNALLVLPGIPNNLGERSNFRLKIGGNANMRHFQDSNYYVSVDGPLLDGFLYRNAKSTGGLGTNSPGEQFPDGDNAALTPQFTDIWLSEGDASATSFLEVTGLNWLYNHPRETYTITSPSIPMPNAEASGSVYGVRGLYEGKANIHTLNIGQTKGADETQSIIEIGPGTNNQEKFYIYSLGMLKNFRGCNSLCAPLNLGAADGTLVTAPNFFITTKDPLYIIHDGDGSGGACCADSIVFYPAAVTNLNTAISTAIDGGDLHIQSTGAIIFKDNAAGTLPLDFTLTKDNEIKILSDQHFINIENDFKFKNADTAHLTIWARGDTANNNLRGFTDLGCATGFLNFNNGVELEYATTSTGTFTGSGLILLRSEFDDVLVGKNFSFNNTAATLESGELMVQAGQDVRITGTTTLTQDGQRSLLFEAKKSAYFGDDFKATMGGTMTNGDLIIKAGYPDFFPNTDYVKAPLAWGTGTCVAGSLNNRAAAQEATQTGGDIWFADTVIINLTPALADSVDTYIRAYNSIYGDGPFSLSLKSTFTSGGDYVDTTLTYAETGNIVMTYTDSVQYAFGANDSVYFLYQAGNILGDPCGVTNCFNPNDLVNTFNQWKGNILFGPGVTYTMNHDGVGPSLISASRDIENQPGANFMFNYTNANLGAMDNLTITAGRHIESHASYIFNFTPSNISSNITMQAGHLAGGCNYDLCKTPERASNLNFNWPAMPTPINPSNFINYSIGGLGQGSILAFDSIIFNYKGAGTILMTAKNGNIETDPYLYGLYPGVAPIVFNHEGTGVVRMEAIDIKLHDQLYYNGTTNNGLNGNFSMIAFDSILTRKVSYTNNLDAGSVLISTEKYKSTACDPGIHQGHIVLGYGADCGDSNLKDTILFDFRGNLNTSGAKLEILAGYTGYRDNSVTGLNNGTLFKDHLADKGKAYGGNITFDFMQVFMAVGDARNGGYAEISTPNGNIWGKDSLQFHGINGNLLIDAGFGSLDDTLHAVRWRGYPMGDVDMLNTYVPYCCEDKYEWRTGNIMLKGGSVDFTNGTGQGSGNVTFRTREGFIDIYDKFDATNMSGHFLQYAGSSDATIAKDNQWGDLSVRDFQYTPVVYSGSVFFGADDNIMLNYGNNNGFEPAFHMYNNANVYAVENAWLSVPNISNPFYSTFYKENIDLCYSRFNVNTNGHLWYFNRPWSRNLHRIYRGCTSQITGQPSTCSPLAGQCETIGNGARPLTFNFNTVDVAGVATPVQSGGLAVVASNYIDLFTAFTYEGGSGSGLAVVPDMSTLKGESLTGYGLYIKSIFNGPKTEIRRATCFNCGAVDSKVGGWAEWPYVGFHDDARIHTQGQRSLVEAPIVEFFGHAELDAETLKSANTELTIKADSMIFHDSAIFAGTELHLLPLTIDPDKRAANAMRYGIVNDADFSYFYHLYGPAITMTDRMTPILELGYQRCYEPPFGANPAPNKLSESNGESTPMVGGDIIVSFKHEFALPIYNTVVANHARISFLTKDNGPDYVNTYIRTDLLRIRNKVEFFTDPAQETKRVGTFKMTSYEQMPTIKASGIYPYHLHLEPNSELSIPGEDSLVVIGTTTIGGYGEAHENVFVKANATIAPGFASLMEHDCTSGIYQGMMTVHDLHMEKDAVLRVSIGKHNDCVDPETGDVYSCTQADTLHVKGKIIFMGKIPMYVLSEVDNLDPGCYLFLIYDELETSPEYIHNLELQTTQIGDLKLRLDKSEPGRVYLCVASTPVPPVQRYINIHTIEGVTSDPVGKLYHYVFGHDDFVFKATYAGKNPFEVYAIGYYSQKDVILTPKHLYDGTYEYTIRQVTEPWDIYFSPEPRPGVGNDGVRNNQVWAYKNTLFVNVDKDDVVSIYNVTGVLYQKIDIPAGLRKVTLDKGVYIVMLKDGSVHKIIIN